MLSNDKELKVYKAVFSTCNIKNKKCRGWELNSNEFTHNKEKKLFELKTRDNKVKITPKTKSKTNIDKLLNNSKKRR